MARILVVDDDPDILKLGEAILASVGHTVFTAEDAMRGMEWLNHIEFDLLLCDANMPLYSGFELITTVRNNPRFANMAVAMLTGLRERKDVERAVTAGADDYIVKPLDPLILIQKVDALFAKKPPLHYPEITLAGTQWSGGSMRMNVTVEGISELGLRVLSDATLPIGSTVDLNVDFFNELGADCPPLKVLSVEHDPTSGKHRAQLIFLGASEALLQKIRRWLYQHGTAHKAA